MLGTENAQLCSKTGSKRQGRLETLGNNWGRSEMVGNTSERVVVFESESECPKTTENACTLENGSSVVNTAVNGRFLLRRRAGD